MATLLIDIGTFLTANGVTTGDGIDLFRDFRPEDPDDVVVLHEYPGSPATPYDSIVHRSVQVAVRGIDADLVRAKALRIFELLTAENRIIEFTPDRWGQVYLRQPPFKMDTDARNRVIYAFNTGITTTKE
jgi:hypothetical protein